MGIGGVNNITALKAATGITDNRLSAHNPNGVGSNTAIGDFLISSIGRWEGVDGMKASLERVNSTPSTLAKGVPGHDTFTVYVDAKRAQDPSGNTIGSLWGDAIGIKSTNLSFTSPDNSASVNNRVVNNVGSTIITLHITCSVDGYNRVQADFTLGGSLNNDATNHGVTLDYDSANDAGTDVWSNSPRIWKAEYSTSGSDMSFTVYPYDPDSLVDDFWYWDASPNESFPPDGSTDGDNTSSMVIAQFDYTQYYNDGDTETMEYQYTDQNDNQQDLRQWNFVAGQNGTVKFI